MRTLELSDIIPVSEYEKQREARRRAAMELRARRRVALGDLISMHFENRATLIYQTQEMMRAEGMTSVNAVLEELEVYNGLIPGPGELSATLFIQLTSDADLRKWLPIFTALEGNLWLKIGSEKTAAQFEPGRTREDKTASVHYIRFALTQAQQRALAHEPAEFVCTLKEYATTAPVGDVLRRELLADLADGGAGQAGS